MFGGLFSTFSDVEQKIAFLLYQVSRKIQFKIKLWSSCDTKHLINDNTTFNDGFLLGLFDWACSHKEVLELETYETLVELFLYEPHLYDQLVAGFKNSVVQLKNDVQTNVGLRGYHTAQTIVAVVEVVELVSLVKNIPKTAGKIGKFADGVKGVAKGAGKTIDDVVDDLALKTLAKEVKYLPGPELPQKIASTFENAIYTNRKLASNQKYFKYHGTNNRTGKKYTWVVDKKYGTEKQLREGLAIRDVWGVQIEYVSEFDVPAGTWVSEGKAAGQGVGYPGGNYQAVILNVPKSWVIRTDKAF